jgi:eukaryotic-like serine/threonine-protein kinase
LLTLEPIFRGRDVQYLLNQILHTDPRPLRQVDKAIPVELETIILKCVSKNAEDRYRSAGALAADLQRYLDHQPIQALRPTVVDRVKKWSLRHPGGLAAGMLVLLIVAMGLFVSNQLISHEQKKAEARFKEAEQLFQQAKQALDLLIEVSEGDLADSVMMIPTRQRILGIALGYYQELVEQRRGDAVTQRELAAVQERIKKILHEFEVFRREVHLQVVESTKVQEALQLSNSQDLELTRFLKRREQERGAFWEKIKDLDEDSRRQRLVALIEEHEKQLDAVLSLEQQERLSQISLQYACVQLPGGIMTFRTPYVIDALKLTADQRKAIRQIEREGWQRGPRRGEGGGPPGPRFPSREDREAQLAKVLHLLTEQQQQAWNRLVGERFADLPEPPPMFRGQPFRSNPPPQG